MPLVVPYNTKLKQSITSHDTTLRVTTGMADICARLTTPVSHIFATVYTASKSEVIIVTGCDGLDLLVQRGVDGTKAQAWPINACIRLREIVSGMVCEDAGEIECAKWWDAIVVGRGLQIDFTNPDAPVLELKPTGVTINTMCGSTVNETGQFTYIPPNWPASCLPTFNPCCGGDDAGGGGLTDACDVTYTPRIMASIIQATTVCGALENLEDAIGGSNTGIGVEAISAGPCITITGAASNPVVGVSPSGLSAGTYNGFTLNSCGMVVDYEAVPAAALSIVGLFPVDVTYNNLADEWRVSVATATVSQQGVVTLADESEATVASPNVQGNHVITWDFLTMYAQAKGWGP